MLPFCGYSAQDGGHKKITKSSYDSHWKVDKCAFATLLRLLIPTTAF